MDICIHDPYCGGCIYQGMPYEEQLKTKDKEVRRLLKENKLSEDLYCGIEGSPSQFRYRNKMEYTFGDMVKGGPMTLGMHQKGKFMSIVTVDTCQLVHEDFNIILKAVLDFTTERGYVPYHKKTHKGLLRNLVVRRGANTGQLLVNIVTASGDFDEKGFANIIGSLDIQGKIVGILRTINDNVADAVKCDELKVLRGVDYYMESISGLDFKVSAFSFFQTNIAGIERLYDYALGLLDGEDIKGRTVYDLYCGTGTITQMLAQKAQKVIGIEIVSEAVEAAKENARLNSLDNCTFISGDVFEKLDSVKEPPDTIVLDPPRVGIHYKALDKIISYGTKKILYISCNPKTLVENICYLGYYRYRAKIIKAFDNFPNTKHIECVALLEKE